MAGLAVLTGWTLHYMLEQLTVGQVALMYRYTTEFKYGKPKPIAEKKTAELSPDELSAEKERLRQQYGWNVEGM